MGAYPLTFFAETQGRVRKNIKAFCLTQPSLAKASTLCEETKNSSPDKTKKEQLSFLPPEIIYQISISHIPLGTLTLRTSYAPDHDKEILKAMFSLRPWTFLQTLSENNIGLDVTSYINLETLLPYRCEQTNLYLMKKGSQPRTTIYDHENLSMNRKGHEQDIFKDTRDMVSLWLWIMAKNYEKVPSTQSTLNVKGHLYLVTGEYIKKIGDRFVINFEIRGINQRSQKTNIWHAQVLLEKTGKLFLPLQVNLNKNLLSIQIKMLKGSLPKVARW